MVTWNDVKIADKGFLINLKRREDRLHDSLLEFEKLKINGVEIYEAVDSLENPELEYMACAASHLEILKKQIENGWEKIIIFEDDFLFIPFKSDEHELIIKNTIDTINIEEYDLLFLGTVLTNNSFLKNKKIIIPDTLIQTTCYVINHSFSKFVIENFNFKDKTSIMFNENIDTFYSILSSKRIAWKESSWFVNSERFLNNNFMIYCSNPIIFSQRPSYSDIQKKYSDTSFYNKIKNLEYYPK